MKKKFVEGVNTLDEQNLLRFINENLGKILGGFLGLLVAIIIMLFGFWRSLFIFFCVSAGIYLGVWADRLYFRRERF